MKNPAKKTAADTTAKEPIKSLSKEQVIKALEQNMLFINQRARFDATPGEFAGISSNFGLVAAALKTLPDTITLT